MKFSLKNETLNSDKKNANLRIKKRHQQLFSCFVRKNIRTLVKSRFPIISRSSSNYGIVYIRLSVVLTRLPSNHRLKITPPLPPSSHELSKSLIRSRNPHILYREPLWLLAEASCVSRYPRERNEGFLPFNILLSRTSETSTHNK